MIYLLEYYISFNWQCAWQCEILVQNVIAFCYYDKGSKVTKDLGKYITQCTVQGIDSLGKVQGIYKRSKAKPTNFVLLRTVEENYGFIELPKNLETQCEVQFSLYFALAHSPAFDFEP